MGTSIKAPTWIWHPEYTGPEGRVYDPTTDGGVTCESLAARGFVDTPDKIEPGMYKKVKENMVPAFKHIMVKGTL